MNGFGKATNLIDKFVINQLTKEIVKKVEDWDDIALNRNKKEKLEVRKLRRELH